MSKYFSERIERSSSDTNYSTINYTSTSSPTHQIHEKEKIHAATSKITLESGIKVYKLLLMICAKFYSLLELSPEQRNEQCDVAMIEK